MVQNKRKCTKIWALKKAPPKFCFGGAFCLDSAYLGSKVVVKV